VALNPLDRTLPKRSSPDFTKLSLLKTFSYKSAHDMLIRHGYFSNISGPSWSHHAHTHHVFYQVAWLSRVFTDHAQEGGGGTPLFGRYGDVPLDRVGFFGLAVLNRVYNFTRLCPKQVLNLSLTVNGITSRETLTGHYKVITNQHRIIFWTSMLLLSVNFFHSSVL